MQRPGAVLAVLLAGGLVLAGYREQRVSALIDDLIAGTAIAWL